MPGQLGRDRRRLHGIDSRHRVGDDDVDSPTDGDGVRANRHQARSNARTNHDQRPCPPWGQGSLPGAGPRTRPRGHRPGHPGRSGKLDVAARPHPAERDRFLHWRSSGRRHRPAREPRAWSRREQAGPGGQGHDHDVHRRHRGQCGRHRGRRRRIRHAGGDRQFGRIQHRRCQGYRWTREPPGHRCADGAAASPRGTTVARAAARRRTGRRR